MLARFIRFTPTNYDLEAQLECLSDESNNCGNEEDVYPIPAKSGDVIKWIMDKSEVTYGGAEASDLRIGLTDCGVLVNDNVGSIVEAENHLYCTATLPEDLPEGCYEFVIYSIHDPIECGDFKGMTLQETIDTGTVLGNVLECTLNDFIP
jgi:hypothetical protein